MKEIQSLRYFYNINCLNIIGMGWQFSAIMTMKSLLLGNFKFRRFFCLYEAASQASFLVFQNLILPVENEIFNYVKTGFRSDPDPQKNSLICRLSLLHNLVIFVIWNYQNSVCLLYHKYQSLNFLDLFIVNHLEQIYWKQFCGYLHCQCMLD